MRSFRRRLGRSQSAGSFALSRPTNARAFGDLEHALGLANRIRAGSVSVNGGMCTAGDLPFGGYKMSGVGREWGVEGIEEYLESKVVAWRV